ncbi:hypothetical protein L3049_10705 [Labilibaculum sp. DW002]|uniref:Uncharacterized protein n=1 Tax=Paralabilibaculum antarcticum TaxID=2912572 RepID=A0ABT5VST0_9BACT|nr:hypothetical protein [Labilibaculum sp. DW002]MDE5418479.1 hypothetical protein [Labilibaculum sp. DW002]
MSLINNILTLGQHGKLEKEIEEYIEVANYSDRLNHVYEDAFKYNNELAEILETERKEALRNLSMAKNLIARIKSNMNSKDQELLKDFILDISIDSQHQKKKELNTDLSQNFEAISNQAFVSIDSSLSRLSTKETITKLDVKSEAISAGVEIGTSLINEAIDAYSKTTEKRKEVQQNVLELRRFIKNATSSIPKLTASINRLIEVSSVLNKINEAFCTKYNELFSLAIPKPKFSFSKDDIVLDIDMKKKLSNLMKLCSEYNKVNQATNIK